ncbi:MAG: urease accessory protein UreD, partial [Pseudomonadota bacterium]
MSPDKDAAGDLGRVSLDGLRLEAVAAARPRAAQPRAVGEARATARIASRGGIRRSVLGDLRQSGSATRLLPRRPGPDLEAVLLNTAGGVTGGDRFRWSA